MFPEVAPIRSGEEIDERALAGYLRGKIEDADGRVAVQQFPGGHSNLTYLVQAGDREYVLRRPPLGPVARLVRHPVRAATRHPLPPCDPAIDRDSLPIKNAGHGIARRGFGSSVAGLRYVEGSYDRFLVLERLAKEDITFSWGGLAPALIGPGLGVTVVPGSLKRVTIRKERVV